MVDSTSICIIIACDFFVLLTISWPPFISNRSPYNVVSSANNASVSITVSFSLLFMACRVDSGGNEFPGRQLIPMPTFIPLSFASCFLFSTACLIAAQWQTFKSIGDVAHPFRNPLNGRQASLFSLLPSTLYSVSSCNPFSILMLSSFVSYFLNIVYKIGLLTLGYVLFISGFISNMVATGVQSSMLLLSFTYKPVTQLALRAVLDDKFSKGGKKPKLVGKTTSSRKLWGGGIDKES